MPTDKPKGRLRRKGSAVLAKVHAPDEKQLMAALFSLEWCWSPAWQIPLLDPPRRGWAEPGRSRALGLIVLRPGLPGMPTSPLAGARLLESSGPDPASASAVPLGLAGASCAWRHVSPGERPRERIQRGRRADAPEQIGHRAVAQQVHVIDAVRPAIILAARQETFSCAPRFEPGVLAAYATPSSLVKKHLWVQSAVSATI
jgi:hypothetical protein